MKPHLWEMWVEPKSSFMHSPSFSTLGIGLPHLIFLVFLRSHSLGRFQVQGSAKWREWMEAAKVHPCMMPSNRSASPFCSISPPFIHAVIIAQGYFHTGIMFLDNPLPFSRSIAYAAPMPPWPPTALSQLFAHFQRFMTADHSWRNSSGFVAFQFLQCGSECIAISWMGSIVGQETSWISGLGSIPNLRSAFTVVVCTLWAGN